MHACVISVLRNVSDIFFSVQAPQALRREEKDKGKKKPSKSESHYYSSSIVNLELPWQLSWNMPAMQETPVRFLGWEDPLKEG